MNENCLQHIDINLVDLVVVVKFSNFPATGFPLRNKFYQHSRCSNLFIYLMISKKVEPLSSFMAHKFLFAHIFRRKFAIYM